MFPLMQVFDWNKWQDGFGKCWRGDQHESIREEFRTFKRQVLENLFHTRDRRRAAEKAGKEGKELPAATWYKLRRMPPASKRASSLSWTDSATPGNARRVRRLMCA
jgi:hypothetical protein